MRTQRFSQITRADAGREALQSVHGAGAEPLDKSMIVLISNDERLHRDLRCAANQTGRMVVRVATPAGAVPVVRVLKPSAVLLDLDLPEEAAWNTGDSLLQEAICPPVILLTGPSEQFDLKTAIRAGSLIDKTSGSSHLLEVVDQTLALPSAFQPERNATQRVLIRWLRPSSWSIPNSSVLRARRITE